MPPEFSHSSFSIEYDEAQREIAIPCKIGVPGSATPLLETTALWDTGATHCAVSSDLAGKLKLAPFSSEEITGIHGTRETWSYVIEIHLPNHVVYKAWEVLRADTIGIHGLLIGMDIIGIGDFALFAGRFFSYRIPPNKNPMPSMGKV